MKFLSYSLGALCLFLLSLPLLSLFLVLENSPNFSLNRQFDQQQISSIENMLIEYDPRFLFNNDNQFIELNETESNALLNYFSQQLNDNELNWMTDNVMSVEFLPDAASLSGTLALKPNIFGTYLNFEANFQQINNMITLQNLRLGDLALPNFILSPFLNYADNEFAHKDNYLFLSSAFNAIKQIDLNENYLALTLELGADDMNILGDQARRLLIDETTRNNLITYQRHLISTLNAIPQSNQSISLNNLLKPLFTLALESNVDPREENQAILLILSCYLFEGLDVEDLLGTESPELIITDSRRITLEARDDLPRHMIGSAAIAAYADNNLSNMLSTYKEVQDSRSFSGFSFSDITANQIGTRIGELASTNQSTALYIQRFFAELSNETDYMPLVGPPDGITESEFIELYVDRNSDDYLNRMSNIKATIDRLAIFSERIDE